MMAARESYDRRNKVDQRGQDKNQIKDDHICWFHKTMIERRRRNHQRLGERWLDRSARESIALRVRCEGNRPMAWSRA